VKVVFIRPAGYNEERSRESLRNLTPDAYAAANNRKTLLLFGTKKRGVH